MDQNHSQLTIFRYEKTNEQYDSFELKTSTQIAVLLKEALVVLPK